jgi:hypothetical protein
MLRVMAHGLTNKSVLTLLNPKEEKELLDN